MMLRVFIITAVLTLPCASDAQKPSDSSQSASAATCVTSPDDAAIYSAALTKVVLKDRDDKRQIVLLSQTSSAYPPALAAFSALAKPDRTELLDLTNPATKADFDAKAKLSCDLTTNPGLSAGVVFLSPKERDELFSKNTDPWKDFAKKYPNAAGFTIVSPIGFNAPHHQALVYVGNSCGMLCGTGYLVLLEKKKDKWIAAKTAKIWISP
jgi:hypothetical protein